MYNHLPRAGFRAKLKMAIYGFWLPYWTNIGPRDLILRFKNRVIGLFKKFPIWHGKVELYMGIAPPSPSSPVPGLNIAL